MFEYQLNDIRINIPPLTFYAPGHLPSRVDEYRKRMKNLSVTFLTFSPNGTNLSIFWDKFYIFYNKLFLKKQKVKNYLLIWVVNNFIYLTCRLNLIQITTRITSSLNTIHSEKCLTKLTTIRILKIRWVQASVQMKLQKSKSTKN